MAELKRVLTKVNVQFISLVGKGANGKAVIWKSAGAPTKPSYSKTVSILSKNDEKHLVYGIVYSPDEVDSQGDKASAEVIKEMSYEFMKNRKTDAVDSQHDFKPDEGFVAESWLVKKNDPVFPDEPEGSWAVAIKVENEETWKLVKSGEIGGLSLAGLAEVEEVEVEKSASGVLQKIAHLLKIGVSKDYNALEQAQDVRSKLYTLMDAISAISNDNTIDDKAAAIMESVKQFQADLDKELTGVQKSGRVISDANMKKLSSAMNILQEVIAAAADTQKSATSSTITHNEDDMNTEQLTKAIADSITPLTTQLTALAAEVAEVKKTQGEQAATVEKIAKSTPGTAVPAAKRPRKL